MSLWDQVNTAENSNEAVTNEKHLPVISVGNLGNNQHKIKVDVGGGKHPNEIDHWIQWVEVQVNGLYVGRTEFSASIMEPIAEFTVNNVSNSKIGAVARCNKHGLWKTEINC